MTMWDELKNMLLEEARNIVIDNDEIQKLKMQ